MPGRRGGQAADRGGPRRRPGRGRSRGGLGLQGGDAVGDVVGVVHRPGVRRQPGGQLDAAAQAAAKPDSASQFPWIRDDGDEALLN